MKTWSYLLFLIMISCSSHQTLDIVPGVSLEIAEYRQKTISDIRYSLALGIPSEKEDPITGEMMIEFKLNSLDQPLILDFNVSEDHITSVYNASGSVPFLHENEHVIIGPENLKEGTNQLAISFKAGELSLNRQDDFLYTLFVPDRASTAFPCFDQPDLKARFSLSLDLPGDWEAVANGSLINSRAFGSRKVVSFQETAPISTYLFSFATGKFQKITDQRDGRTMTLFHRETDSLKVQRNTSTLFDLHWKSLQWMEDYTGINYPFEKFDFVAIPGFQYGGMEHPGAILYRARSLWLDETATQNQYLARASVIAHETAHMWFGNLVTMRWFNDVWMKEVFANFMADKIVNPSFPDIDHDLKFLLRHFPASYAVDRTKGANAVRQPLENLKQAGMMYGAIIYNKAPIMMKKLEKSIGEAAFQEGVKEYLNQYANGNADWNDLIDILDQKTNNNLQAWSEIWISQPGMPIITTEQSGAEVKISQSDPWNAQRTWIQPLSVQSQDNSQTIDLNQTNQAITLESAQYILPNGGGLEYGAFVLDSGSISKLLVEMKNFQPYKRGLILLDIHETFLQGRMGSDQYWSIIVSNLRREENKLITQMLLGNLELVFWKFMDPNLREIRSQEMEDFLWEKIEDAETTDIKSAYFNTFRRITLSNQSLDKLYRLWNKEMEIPGLVLSENDYTNLALELGVRNHPNWEVIKIKQLENISNPDNQRRFAFIVPALDPNITVRDDFFESLKQLKNREVEPWVLTALRYLHHPLRAKESERYLMPSLELLEEIQLTGDIFFPKRWLDATFSGHSSKAAQGIVEEFLGQYQNYNARLKQKILQSVDMLYRSAAQKEGINLL